MSIRGVTCRTPRLIEELHGVFDFVDSDEVFDENFNELRLIGGSASVVVERPKTNDLEKPRAQGLEFDVLRQDRVSFLDVGSDLQQGEGALNCFLRLRISTILASDELVVQGV